MKSKLVTLLLSLIAMSSFPALAKSKSQPDPVAESIVKARDFKLKDYDNTSWFVIEDRGVRADLPVLLRASMNCLDRSNLTIDVNCMCENYPSDNAIKVENVTKMMNEKSGLNPQLTNEYPKILAQLLKDKILNLSLSQTELRHRQEYQQASQFVGPIQCLHEHLTMVNNLLWAEAKTHTKSHTRAATE